MSPAARRNVWRTATSMRLAMLGGPRPAQLPEDRQSPSDPYLIPPRIEGEGAERRGLTKLTLLEMVVTYTGAIGERVSKKLDSLRRW